MQDLLSTTAPLLFMHMPKTAGGSMLELVHSAFPTPDLYPFYHDDVHRAAQERGPARIIYGHFFFGIHEALNSPPRYCCFLRNPIERTISHFYHLRASEPSEHSDLARRFETVGDFVERSGYWAANNMMCRMITGVTDGRVPPDDVLSRWARSVLRDHFPVFGIYDLLPLSLEVLRRTLGLPIDDVPTVNKGSYRHRDLSADDIDRVAEANRADLDLYTFAVRRFLSTIVPRAFGDDSAAALAAVGGLGPQADGDEDDLQNVSA